MIRLFVALPLERQYRLKLAKLGQTIHGARAVPEHQIHLTLRFIGDVTGQQAKEIKDALTEVEHPAISLSIKGVDHFPPRGNPRVIWAGVEPVTDITRLRNKINKALKLCNIEPEQRKYHPHITLARLKNSSPARVAHFLEVNALLQSPPFMAEKFHLYSSQLSHDGARHTLEQEYILG